MSKQLKANLKAIIAGTAPELEEPQAETASAPAAKIVPLEATAEPVRTAKPAAGKGTLRERAVPQTLYLEPEVYDQLRELAFTEKTKMHRLVLEGLDLLFKKRGLKTMAQLAKSPK